MERVHAFWRMFSSRLSNHYFSFPEAFFEDKKCLENWISITSFDHSAKSFRISSENIPVGLSNLPSTCPEEPFRKMFGLKKSCVQRNTLRQKTFVWKIKFSKVFQDQERNVFLILRKTISTIVKIPLYGSRNIFDDLYKVKHLYL